MILLIIFASFALAKTLNSDYFDSLTFLCFHFCSCTFILTLLEAKVKEKKIWKHKFVLEDNNFKNHVGMIMQWLNCYPYCQKIKTSLCLQECQFTYCNDPLDLTASNGSMEQTRDQLSLNNTDGEWDRNFQFSFSAKPGNICELQQDIRRYVKGFEKDIGKVDIDSQITRSNSYDPAEYKFQASKQSLLFDHVFLKNRLESGNLLLCNGGCISTSFLPFASII